MTHRAESILVAVTSKVTGLTTTGGNVMRGPVYPFAATVAAGLTVSMGVETPHEPNLAFQDEQLAVNITAHVKAADGTLDTVLNKIAAEVYAAMMVPRALGLSYVLDTRWDGRTQPQREIEESPITQQTFQFQVIYRHSYASTEA